MTLTNRARTVVTLAGIVLLSCFAAELWAGHKLLNEDEIFVLQTDSVRSIADVARIQMRYPISLDPLFYHEVTHLSLRLLGTSAFALRLPSLLGYLGMQVSIFFFVRKAVSAHHEAGAANRIAAFAACLPLATQTLFYAAEARPYGMLLGLFGLTIVSWQAATRFSSGERPHWALPMLALAIGLALNTHFFAVLLLPVLYLAEATRSLARRRIDLPVVAALLSGTACEAFTLPVQRAVKQFHAHYYSPGQVSAHTISLAYRAMLVDYAQASVTLRQCLVLGLFLFAIIFFLALIVRWHSFCLPVGEGILLLSLAALPVMGFLLARFFVHSYEPRFVLGAITALVILLALLLAPQLARPRAATGIFCGLAAAILFHMVHEIRFEKAKTTAVLSSFSTPASVRQAIAADPAHVLYFAHLGMYELAQYYTPDPILRAHTVLVYSSASEIYFDHHDTEALTAEHLTHFTSLRVARYEDVLRDTAAHTWISYESGQDFTPDAFPQDRAVVSPLGRWGGGNAVSVRFPRLITAR